MTAIATYLALGIIPQVTPYAPPGCRTFTLPANDVPVLVLCTRLSDDVEDWKVDWTNRLCGGDTILSARVDVLAGDVVISQLENDATSTSFFISGGSDFKTSIIRIVVQGSTVPNRFYEAELAIRTL